jgi:hypothetical protein
MFKFQLEHIFYINGWLDKVEERDPGILRTLVRAVSSMDFEYCYSKESEEQTMKGRILLSPPKVNNHIKAYLRERHYKPFREDTFNSADVELLMKLRDLPVDEQRLLVKKTNEEVFTGFQEADFLAFGNLFEVQLGKYSFAISDQLKIIELIDRGIGDTGAILLPMKSMQKRMSSGPAYYENILGSFTRRKMDFSVKHPIALIGVAVVPATVPSVPPRIYDGSVLRRLPEDWRLAALSTSERYVL